MRASGILILIVATAASIDATVFEVTKPTEWWETATIYQIWPRSFKDSDGNGIGDLNGITSKLEHFVDMGVDMVWISPMYPSPMVDSGYDISDFRDVNPTYGTLEDFEKLVARAKELGLKVALDFVPNHTSDKHEWFVKAKAGIEPYTDYFIWNEGIVDANGKRQPPNNWLSRLNSGSAWEWEEERQAYYFHQFAPQQIDLNFRNPLVIQEMLDIMTFWLDLGIDGFRIDAVPFMVEDDKLRDEPESGWSGFDWPNYYYLNHIYVEDQPETYDIMKIMGDHVANYTESTGDGNIRIIMTEAYSKTDSVVEYYDYDVHIPFNFNFLKNTTNFETANITTASDAVNIITDWMENMPVNGTANWVLGNHDNNRVTSKYGESRSDGMSMMLCTLPGVAIIFNGDEIGMTDTDLTWEETEDRLACNSDREHYQSISRDRARTPYQWDNTTSGGFSTNSTTMLPVNPNYVWLNLAAQKEAEVSHYKNIQALIELRKRPVLKEGSLDVRVINENVIAIARELPDDKSMYMVFNWNNETSAEFSLEEYGNVPETLQVLIADISSGIAVGDVFSKENIVLPASGAVVLEGIDSE